MKTVKVNQIIGLMKWKRVVKQGSSTMKTLNNVLFVPIKSYAAGGWGYLAEGNYIGRQLLTFHTCIPSRVEQSKGIPMME